MTPPAFGDPRINSNGWAKVEQNPLTGCWHWHGAIDTDGYGQITRDGRTGPAHRYFYTVLFGAIPDGLVIDHLCRVRGCVNPAHLEPVTPRENVLRGHSPAARAHRENTCAKGHPLDDAYTYVGKSGHTNRQCRQCLAEHNRRYYRDEDNRRADPTPGETCANGHDLTEVGVFIYGRTRRCKECHRQAQRRAYAAKKAREGQTVKPYKDTPAPGPTGRRKS